MKRNTLGFILGLLLVLSVVASYVLIRQTQRNLEITAAVERIEKEYQQLESEIIATISDEVIISNLITDSYTFEVFSQLAAKPYGLIVYEQDSAIIWTNNFITPVKAQMVYNDAPLFISESNGEYIIFQHDFPGNIHVIGFLPLQFDFGIKNKYLNHVKTPGIQIPEHLILQPRADANTVAVHAVNGNALFYISSNPDVPPVPGYTNILYILLSVSLILLLIILYFGAKWLVSKFNRVTGIVMLLATLVAIYWLINALLYQQVFSYLPLFDPQYYGSPGIADSTGDLLIKTILLFCFALFFSNFFYVKLPAAKSTISKFAIILIGVLLVALSLLTGQIFRSLIMDSSISFNINNFFSLDYFSFVGFLCISILLLSYFFISIRCVEIMVRGNNNKYQFALIVFGIGVLAIVLQKLTGRAMQPDMIALVTGFVLIRIFLLRKKIGTRSLGGMMIWLIFFSSFSAYVFHTSITHKEDETKRLFALKKSIEKDPITEYLFSGIEVNVVKQLAMQGVTRDNEEKIRPGVINQIRQDLQSNYFKKYATDIFVFKNDTALISTNNEIVPTRYAFIDAIENNGEFTSAENLYFINDYTGNYYYLAELAVRSDSGSQFMAYLRMVPKKFTGESIYPELLIDDDLRTSASFVNFDYAIYNDHTLSEREGEYSYPLMDIFYMNKDVESLTLKQNGYSHYIYKVTENKKVVVSIPEENWFQPISIFSYLFFFYLIFLVIILLLEWLSRVVQGNLVFKEWLNASLQNKIQTSVISLIIFAFIMMGVATIYYIANQYNFSHKQRLLSKIEGVQTNIDVLFNDNRKKAGQDGIKSQQLKKIGNRVSELSEIHEMDINIYGPGGDLVSSSQPDIFDKGLVSKKMQPLAYFKMSCDKETWYIQTEKIGELPFLSAYVPVLDDTGETMFYLNLPYFATEQNLRAEISSFMVTLVNVYVLLLILAGVIAFFVSKSITSPLATIAGKFKGIKLGKANEPIHWTHNDEIGLLVAEYNKMLQELENSAGLLAKSERESAWRDMAKQVAHEIKNPLTPMRLSIQHLQRAIQTNAPNVKELTSKVTDTILEQIDNLTHIASEFSNFAVMPKAVNEQLCLNDLLENVTSLFNEHDDIEITLSVPDNKIEVFADKNQLLRVFNNVIKNAIQAIPDDRKGVIAITLQMAEHRAMVKVADNGKGIPDYEKDKVFVPNFTTKSSGMGIGLAMCKNIVESAGGYIWFESNEGEGTIFFIELPVI